MEDLFQAYLNEQAAPEASAPEAAPEAVVEPEPPLPAVEPAEAEPQVEAPTTPPPESKSQSQGQGQRQQQEPLQPATDSEPDPQAADPAPDGSKTPADTGGTGSTPSKSQEQLDAAEASLLRPLKPRPGTTTGGASAYGDLPPVEALRKEAVDIVGFLDTSRLSAAEHVAASEMLKTKLASARKRLFGNQFFAADDIRAFLKANPNLGVTIKDLEADGYTLGAIPTKDGIVKHVYDLMAQAEAFEARQLQQRMTAHEQRVRDIGRQVERNERRLAEIRQVTAGFVGPEQPQPLNEAQKRIASAVTGVDQVLRLVLQLPPSSNDLAPQSRREAAMQTVRDMLEREGLGKYADLVEKTPEELRAILAGLDNLNKAYSFDRPSRQPSATDRRQESESRQAIMDSISRR